MLKPATRTLVTFLLDRTGSMEPIRDDTIGAFNAYLEGLQKGGAPIDFTFVQFDSVSIDKIYVQTPVGQVPRLTRDTYQPRASTPLIDAAYKTVQAVEDSFAGDRETKVVICFHTDGQENSSTEHTWDELNALIKEKSRAGSQFNSWASASTPTTRARAWASRRRRPWPMTIAMQRRHAWRSARARRMRAACLRASDRHALCAFEEGVGRGPVLRQRGQEGEACVEEADR